MRGLGSAAPGGGYQDQYLVSGLILISPHLHMLEPHGQHPLVLKLKYFGFKLRIKFYICSGFILSGRVSDINDGIYQLSKNESPSLQRI